MNGSLLGNKYEVSSETGKLLADRVFPIFVRQREATTEFLTRNDESLLSSSSFLRVSKAKRQSLNINSEYDGLYYGQFCRDVIGLFGAPAWSGYRKTQTIWQIGDLSCNLDVGKPGSNDLSKFPLV